MIKSLFLLILISPLYCQAISYQKSFDIRRAKRQVESHTIKTAVSSFDVTLQPSNQNLNGDLERYSDFRGNFGKALAHDASGFINSAAFYSLQKALSSTKVSNFDNILLGEGTVKLANPQANYAFSLSSNDAWANVIPPAPTFSSAETAGEMVEDYWSVLVRDVPFNDFDTDATVAQAVNDLNNLTVFMGPKIGNSVTPQTFLRGNTPGDLIGPYISQFLYQEIPFGATTIDQVFDVPVSGTTNNFLTTFADWFTVINGGVTGDMITFDLTPRFIRTPRDLTQYVHVDFPNQAYLSALLILNSYGSSALDPNNPYLNNPTQGGFVTYGLAQVLELIGDATTESLKNAWYHKWQVNCRVRPEEYGFYLQKQLVDGLDLGISSELTNSASLPLIFAAYGTYYLPSAYPEGCPTHPSYPAGHAVIAGACTTILKAFYNEDFSIPSPLEPNAANDTLVAYGGSLYVGDELNKLASNISIGRNIAGVHYRSDGYQGMLLGEQIAIDILNNAAFLNNENFDGFRLTKFNGKQITVGKKKTP